MTLSTQLFTQSENNFCLSRRKLPQFTLTHLRYSNRPFPSLYRPAVQSCCIPSKHTVPGSQSKHFSGHH